MVNKKGYYYYSILFMNAGWQLEKFKGFYGVGYYARKLGNTPQETMMNEWKYVGSSLDSVSRSIIIRGM